MSNIDIWHLYNTIGFWEPMSPINYSFNSPIYFPQWKKKKKSLKKYQPKRRK